MKSGKKCIECQKTIDLNARLCVECGSHQDWRRHLKTWTPVMGFLLAFLAFLFSIAPQFKSAFFPSPANFSAKLQSVSERRITFHVSNLGERTLIIDPVLKCVSADKIDEEIVDYEKPFHVRFTTVEAQLVNPITIPGLGGSESATFSIPENYQGNWLERSPKFLPPDDERVSDVQGAFALGFPRTWIGVDRSSKIPTFHFIGKDDSISLQPVSEITTFCQLTTVDPVTGKELDEGFAIWQTSGNHWQGGRANQLYNILGSLLSISAHGLNETDPKICKSESAPLSCIKSD